ncbi:LacI family DNA-binding transcriptional regulator [Sneathia sanguinegens]|uniref:LacI family DNA-binding transcriptional regulator n=1 Tax=Sneathia sanguinegens TaxID=40543 RepID=A0ABT7HIH1_9FUSO|nr:LacI family DNA-binding transcriptional regulator [Sneathia sanguinegens]MDK9580310.1 LacI family DNA-binding transcriptional regulator [Sneathia sanguinegens]MDU7496475.1 LacI family DNA-binding transcriptional regulator [Sneathia sanguinegens]
MKIRVKDIADKLGLSTSTVSVVLNNRPSRVSEKTKQKIFDMANKLNYQKDIDVNIDDKLRAKTIAILIVSFSCEEQMKIVVKLVEELKKINYTSLVIQTKDEDILNVLDIVVSKAVDGIILLEPNELDILEQYFEIFSLPKVIFTRSDKIFNFNCFSIDKEEKINEKNIEYIIKKLIDLVLYPEEKAVNIHLKRL